MKIYVGTSGYGYKKWKGKFYPEKISPEEMPRFYSERFGAVEINNTFYRMPKENVLASWAAQVPTDFVFALKAPQVITHLKRLKNVDGRASTSSGHCPFWMENWGPSFSSFPRVFTQTATHWKIFCL